MCILVEQPEYAIAHAIEQKNIYIYVYMTVKKSNMFIEAMLRSFLVHDGYVNPQ